MSTTPPTAPKTPTSKVTAPKTETTGNSTTKTSSTAVTNTTDTQTNIPVKPKVLKDTKDGKDNYKPIAITYMSGKFKGMTVNLGSNAIEVSDSQSYEWADGEKSSKGTKGGGASGDGIRTGAYFGHVSPLTIEFTVDFYSPVDNDGQGQQDVSPLSEDLKNMGRILPNPTDPKDAIAPPFLLIKIGATTYSKAVLSSIETKRSAPLQGEGASGGFKYAEVTLKFTVYGGKGSEYQSAPPFAPTPTEWQRSQLTDAQANALANNLLVQEILPDCIGASGISLINQMRVNNTSNSPSAWISMPTDVLVNMAVGGQIPAAVLSDPGVQAAIKSAVAFQVVSNQSGLQSLSPSFVQSIASSIINDPTGKGYTTLNSSDFNKIGSVSGIGAIETYTSLADQTKRIYEDIIAQKFSTGQTSENSTDGVTAGQKLITIAKCGSRLRGTGINVVSNNSTPSGNDQHTLNGINSFLGSNLSDAELIAALGLPADTPSSIIQGLKGHRVYTSQSQLASVGGTASNGSNLNGLAAWSGYQSTQGQVVNKLNTFLGSSPSAQDIQTAFGISDNATLAAAIQGLGTISDQQDFVDKLTKVSPSTTTSDANTMYIKYFQYQNSH